jgi:alkanesulfonate monooxygenase SsuD/methylene tetrahydromethanopterin reductase-like flavin-dependent oxidoreductase (luciferase family)
MKIGFFTMPVHPRGRNYTQTLKEDREAVILADKLGFSEALVGEHLTDEVENIPNSLAFIASFVDATRQIKLGTAVANLPHVHPVVAAATAAMLDHMLQGRFIFGTGAGILRTDAEALGLLEQDRAAMFVEAMDHILAIWAGKPPYNLKGKYWTITLEKTQWPEIGLGNIVKPYQKPHPPILGSATDPNSQGLIALGKRGWLPASSNFLHTSYLKNHWANYAQGCREGDRKADRAVWRVARSIFVADDDRTAAAYGKNDPQSPYRHYMQYLSTKLAKARRMGTFKGDPAMPDEAVTLDYIMENVVIAGGVSSVTDQILALHEASGGFGTLLYAGKGWADPRLGRKSMELMAEKVMPAVNAAIETPRTRA